MGRVGIYSSIVAAAAEQAAEGGSLPHEVLAALLESPYQFQVSGKLRSDTVYREIPVQWSAQGQAPLCNNALVGAVHEVSQTFVRPLSFGRKKCFRLHRFSLSPERAEEVMSALSNQALMRSDAAGSSEVGEEGESAEFRGSNVGGYQDITDDQDPSIHSVREAFRLCVLKAAEVDTSAITADGDATPPNSPRCEGSAVWLNVSHKGSLNLLHQHGTCAFAAVAYAKVAKASCTENTEGSLLLRLSRGCGASFMEPDEDLHVPRMWEEHQELSSSTESDDLTEVLYLRVQPRQGSILIFPAWLPHAVTPHFQTDARIAFASNWD